MTKSVLEQLHHADTSLTRAFVANIACGVATFVLAFVAFVAGVHDSRAATVIEMLIGLLRFGLFIWYASAVGTAAHLVGGTRWHYVAWVLAAPFVAMLPIPMAAWLGLTPLAIKFLLGSQLQTAIRTETWRTLHEAPTPPETTAM